MSITFRSIIDRFGYLQMARLLGLPSGTVSSWRSRNQIPPEHWQIIVAEAELRHFDGVTLETLAVLESQRAVKRGRQRPCSSPESAAA